MGIARVAGACSPVAMVNIPKQKKAYCKGKECKKHTLHKVSQYKTGKASLCAQGKRRYDRKQQGYGGQSSLSSTRRPRPLRRLCSASSVSSASTSLTMHSSVPSTSSLSTRRSKMQRDRDS